MQIISNIFINPKAYLAFSGGGGWGGGGGEQSVLLKNIFWGCGGGAICTTQTLHKYLVYTHAQGFNLEDAAVVFFQRL